VRHIDATGEAALARLAASPPSPRPRPLHVEPGCGHARPAWCS
jgi:hypothetical protein